MKLPNITHVNLDAEETAYLREFAATIGQDVRPVQAARQIFPARPVGYVRATKNLCAYAWNKLTAIELRKEGNIQDALKYEAICDSIYKTLPKFARW